MANESPFRVDLTSPLTPREQHEAQYREQYRLAEMVRVRRAAVDNLDTPSLFAQHHLADDDGAQHIPGYAQLSDFEPWGDASQQDSISHALQIGRRFVTGATTGSFAPPPFVAFVGGYGTGKSLLAWAIAGELASQHGWRTRVIRLSAMVRDLREPWRDRSGPSENQRLAVYVEAPFLAIDEVSRHAFYGQQIHQHLYDVINARLEDELPTVLTTNEDQAGLAEILGGALMDRLATGGVVNFGEVSYRRRPKGPNP